MRSHFPMKDLGSLKYFLGIGGSSLGIYLCQRKYVLEIIFEVRLSGSKLAPTPLETNHNLAKAVGAFFPILDRY